MERAERERSAARLEGQISDLQKAAEARIASLPPAEAADYRRLQAENAALSKDIEAKQSELEAANREVRVVFPPQMDVRGFCNDPSPPVPLSRWRPLKRCCVVIACATSILLSRNALRTF
jgi:hypothetical protein